jgi:hypothetical protein
VVQPKNEVLFEKKRVLILFRDAFLAESLRARKVFIFATLHLEKLWERTTDRKESTLSPNRSRKFFESWRLIGWSQSTEIIEGNY